jgi:GntR family transcriptional regulator
MKTLYEPELAIQGGMPIHCQIEDQIRGCVVWGSLSPGEQLPTAREVAVELGINPAAVERAYEELEQEGYLSSEDGSGTFVSFRPPRPLPEAGVRGEIEALALKLLDRADQAGLSTEDVVNFLRILDQRRFGT